MPEFTQSWAFWFLVVDISFAAGFILAIILARSSKGSRMEEKIEETITLKSKDMPPWKISIPFDDKKDTYGIVTKNNPRTD